MIIENKLLKKVKELGLNSYEAKIWTALLSRGVSTAGEISDIANVPRSRSYDVLESLEKKGFIIMKVGKPIQYIAVSPEEVLDRVKKNVMNNAEEQIEVLDEFQGSDMLTELTTLHNEGIEAVDPTDIAGFIKSTDSIVEQMKTMIKSSTSSILITANEQSVKTIEADLTRYLKKALSNNVKVTVRTPVPSKILTDLGVTTVVMPTQGNFMIVDKKASLFTITEENTHPSYQTAIWVESPYLAATMQPNVQVSMKTTITKKV